MRCARESVPKETEWTIVVFDPHREYDEMCERISPKEEWTIVVFDPCREHNEMCKRWPRISPERDRVDCSVFYPHRERDELCERVAALTAQNQSLSQREEELYQQVKRSIALVEQAQLEQTEVGLKCCVSLWLTCLEACFNDVIDTEESLWCWVSVLYSKCFLSESSHLINFAAV